MKEYYEKLFEVIAPLQITRGGSVILMQVENEYGYFGDDKSYLDYMKQLMIDCGCEVPMVTSDGPWEMLLTAEKWKVFYRPEILVPKEKSSLPS